MSAESKGLKSLVGKTVNISSCVDGKFEYYEVEISEVFGTLIRCTKRRNLGTNQKHSGDRWYNTTSPAFEGIVEKS